ncbi:MAG: hypothetical protein R2731_13805 [Nocardioides sp.]
MAAEPVAEDAAPGEPAWPADGDPEATADPLEPVPETAATDHEEPPIWQPFEPEPPASPFAPPAAPDLPRPRPICRRPSRPVTTTA